MISNHIPILVMIYQWFSKATYMNMTCAYERWIFIECSGKAMVLIVGHHHVVQMVFSTGVIIKARFLK